MSDESTVEALETEAPGLDGEIARKDEVAEIQRAVQKLQEQVLDLVDDEDLETANLLFDDIDRLGRRQRLLMREEFRRAVDQEVLDRARREVAARYTHWRPQFQIAKAERDLLAAVKAASLKHEQRMAFEDALWDLHVAYGFAMTRAVETHNGVGAFREQVIEVLTEQAEVAASEVRARDLASVIKIVRHLGADPVRAAANER